GAVPPASEGPDEPRALDASHEFIQPLAVPPPLHVRLAEPEGSVPEHAIEEARVVHVRVTRLRAIQLDTAGPEPRGEPVSRRAPNRPPSGREPSIADAVHPTPPPHPLCSLK